LRVPLRVEESVLHALRILEIVHALAPTLEVVRPEFSAMIFQRLDSPTLTMGFHSFASQIIYHFPFLFDFEQRHLFFKMIGFDLYYSLTIVSQVFAQGPWNRRLDALRVKTVLRRDHIFEDGMKLLRIIGPGMLRFEVAFQGEEGIGLGPTQEFFTKFSHELCRTEHKLWRNESSGEYAFSKKGLFPRPDASPEMFYKLGLLIGKAMLMEQIVSIPFSTAFVKLVLGESITLGEVDLDMERSLSEPEGLIGMPLVYPGIEGLELVPSGTDVEVTRDNLADYVRLVRDKTIAIPEIVAQFRNGLSTVVPWEALKLFSAQETLHLIGGQDPHFSKEELVDHIVISHGYTKTSPQIIMLLEVLEELSGEDQAAFIRFVTGADKLPVGGLGNLKPSLTIALRSIPGQDADRMLPSVMTCTNYFKLPEYSAKDIMREKLRQAIMDGQDSFLLS
jgi:hypothetical protein